MKPIYEDIFPSTLAEGNLYISRAYNTTAHLCADGCGFRVVLPLGKGGWKLVNEKDLTLTPSVHVPKCNSHYWIRDGRVKWARPFSSEDIQDFSAADQQEYTMELQSKGLRKVVMTFIHTILRRH